MYDGRFQHSYSSPLINKMTQSSCVKLAGCVSSVGGKGNVHKALIGHPERKSPLGKSGRIRQNIKI
jgi:hypothetical protein